jgi:hypothetical protein
MTAILRSIYCFPCVWSVFCLVITLGSMSWVRNNWVPFRGPLPSDGELDGFYDDADRMKFFDTHDLRFRTAAILGVIGLVTWIIGGSVSIFILKSLGA